MKIVIVDDDIQRREKIKSIMPSYSMNVACGFGQTFINMVMPDVEGTIPSAVIINGNDEKGMGLQAFEWIRLKSMNERIAGIPVVVLVDDEFSDRAMEFLDIGDAFFYEGEVDEDRMYSALMQAIEEMEFMEPVEEPAYQEEKSASRALGLSFRPEGETEENKRKVALDMDAQLGSLGAVLERNAPAPQFLNKIRMEHGLEPIEPASEHVGVNSTDEEDLPVMIGDPDDENHSKLVYSEFDENELPEEFRLNKKSNQTKPVREADPLAVEQFKQLRERLRNNSANSANANTQATNQTSRIQKKTIVVVDDEKTNLQICDLFLSSKYNVVMLDSGMKAIDYFVKNTADLILLDTYMPNLGGVQTLYSVRYQAQGRAVPVIYMIDDRYPVSQESLAGEYVVGIIRKPLSAGGLNVAVDGFFRRQVKR